MDEVTIQIEFSADAIDNNGFLTNAHIDDYAESLRKYIVQEYPNATVKVVLGIGNRVDVFSDDYLTIGKVGAEVEQLIADHWQPWIDKIATSSRKDLTS
jgi:hypothetical protein